MTGPAGNGSAPGAFLAQTGTRGCGYAPLGYQPKSTVGTFVIWDGDREEQDVQNPNSGG